MLHFRLHRVRPKSEKMEGDGWCAGLDGVHRYVEAIMVAARDAP